jgi:hypothetical protein
MGLPTHFPTPKPLSQNKAGELDISRQLPFPGDKHPEHNYLEAPFLVSFAEATWMAGCEDGEEIPAILHQFAELRTKRELGLPNNRDDFWGLMDPENAIVVWMMTRNYCESFEGDVIRVLVIGTGVGLVEKMLLEVDPRIQIDTVDIYGSNEEPTIPLDERQQTYQVKPGQEVGMFIKGDDLVTIHLRDSIRYLEESVEAGLVWDIVIIDGDHRIATVDKELELITVTPLVSDGGLIFVDNYNQMPTNPGPTLAVHHNLMDNSLVVHVSERGGFTTSLVFALMDTAEDSE